MRKPTLKELAIQQRFSKTTQYLLEKGLLNNYEDVEIRIKKDFGSIEYTRKVLVEGVNIIN